MRWGDLLWPLMGPPGSATPRHLADSTHFSGGKKPQHFTVLQQKPDLKQQLRKRIGKKWGGVSLHLSSPASLYLVKLKRDNCATFYKDETAQPPLGLPQVPVPLKNEQGQFAVTQRYGVPQLLSSPGTTGRGRHAGSFCLPQLASPMKMENQKELL